MIIKHGRHIFGEIQEMHKDLWAFVFFTVLFGCRLADQANYDHIATFCMICNYIQTVYQSQGLGSKGYGSHMSSVRRSYIPSFSKYLV